MINLKRNPMKSVFVFLITLLLFQNSFASDVYSLLAAMRQEKIEDVKTVLTEGIDPNEINNFWEVPSIEVSKLLLENEKKPMALSHFLKLVLGSSAETYDESTKTYKVNNETVAKKDSLIKWVLEEKKADPNEITRFHSFPSIEVSKILLGNKEKPMDPTYFLSLILKTRENDLSYKTQYMLANLALKMGANPNDKRVFDAIVNEGIAFPVVIELLFNNEYKKVDTNIFCHYLNEKLPLLKMLGNENRLSVDPATLIDLKYRHLNNTVIASLPRIPRIFHHIWVTNERVKREIPDTDIQYMLNSYKIISEGDRSWEHIVWTNNKSLIPVSIAKLEANGVKVRELSELKNELKMAKKIDDLIEKDLFGMAFDAARLDVIRCCGGVISDMNYEFYRGLKSDIHRYDFFANSHLQTVRFQAFGAIPHHPILEAAVDLMNSNYHDQAKIAALLNVSENSKRLTYVITGGQLTAVYYKQANRYGTVDVLYPENGDYLDSIKKDNEEQRKLLAVYKRYLGGVCGQELAYDEKELDQDEFVLNNEICGPRYISIGNDRSDESWVGPNMTEN